eukprot:5811174-Amphidinium_carterae.1
MIEPQEPEVIVQTKAEQHSLVIFIFVKSSLHSVQVGIELTTKWMNRTSNSFESKYESLPCHPNLHHFGMKLGTGLLTQLTKN